MPSSSSNNIVSFDGLRIDRLPRQFDYACWNLGLQSISRVILRVWWTRFRKRLLLKYGAAIKSVDPDGAIEIGCRTVTEALLSRKLNLAFDSSKSKTNSKFSNTHVATTGIDRDAPLIRELAFNNYGWPLDERRARFTLPLLAALAQWRQQWVLNILAQAFWKLKTSATLSSRRLGQVKLTSSNLSSNSKMRRSGESGKSGDIIVPLISSQYSSGIRINTKDPDGLGQVTSTFHYKNNQVQN